MRGTVRAVPPRAALVSVLMTASQLVSRGGVDNVLAATQVRDRIDAGAKTLRIEADFVTCSQ